MFRPQTTKIYDPENPEYQLASHYSQELFITVSPKILYWKLNHTLTNTNRDEVDDLYGESSQKSIYEKPVQIYAKEEINPIIQELTKLGLEQKDEIILFTNIIDIHSRLGSPPKSGDIFRISYVVPGAPDMHKFYIVNRAIPDTATMYNFCFINYLIYGENTAMENVPEEIKYSEITE